jgi:hypothetical protein
MRTKNIIGAGFLASISGIEITNIVSYMVFGRETGVLSILFISIMFLATIYIQQAITLPRVLLGKRFSILFSNFSNRIHIIYKVIVYVSSNLLLLVNILVISYILAKTIGGSVIAYIIFILVLSFTIAGSNKASSLEKILIILSLTLLLYMIALVYEITNPVTNNMVEARNQYDGKFSLYFLLSALWGSIASPYSLIIQEDSDTFSDLWYGFLFGVFISTSIAYYAYFSGLSFKGINDLLRLPFYPDLSSKILVAGIFASVLLASSSILTVNTALISGYKRIIARRYYGTLNIVYLLIAGTILLAPIYYFEKYLESLLVNIVLYVSSIVGILFSTTIIMIGFTHYMLYKDTHNKVFRLNTVILTIISVITMIIGVYGLIP